MAGKRLKKKSDEHFIKTFNLMNFRVFNPRYKECLTGSERGLLDYILMKKLTYTGKGHDFGGNTIKIDKTFKMKMLKEMNLSIKTYEGLITKLINDGIFNRIANGFFQVNPYVFAKGEDVKSLRDLGIYSDNTIILRDKKNVCTEKPAEDPWAKPEEDEETDEEVDEEILEPSEKEVQSTPAPSHKRRPNSLINNFF